MLLMKIERKQLSWNECHIAKPIDVNVICKIWTGFLDRMVTKTPWQRSNEKMKKEYIEHYSKCLNKQMHLCIYGHAGVTVLGFPTQDSNCHNYEDFGIIYHLSDFIEQGRIQIVTVDSCG